MRELIFVFSYNRGIFLANTISSLVDYCPRARIVVIDDRSEDPKTLKILDSLKERFEVLKTPNAQESSDKHGGLYRGMNLALELASNRAAQYALFVQDDMQCVRPVTEADWERVNQFFELNLDAAELYVNFLKPDDFGDPSAYILLPGKVAYARRESDPRVKAFSDTGIVHVERMRKVFERIPVGELVADKYARSAGVKLGFSAFPFLMFLPLPRTWRGRTQSLFYWLAERIGRTGFYPYTPMSEDKVKAFLTRPPEEIPVGVSWLVAPTLPSCRTVVYEGGFKSLKAHGSTRLKLGTFLLRCEARWGRFRKKE